MKQQRNIRDGIGLYSPSEPKNRPLQDEARPSYGHKPYRKLFGLIPENQASFFLLAAVQLLTVWFLVLSWWQSLTSVLPIQTDTLRLYTLCFLFTAVFVFIWNAPLRTVKKGIFLILLFCLAVSFIRRHLDAAVNVLNFTANAYLTVLRPDASPYPIQSVPEPQMALMFAIFLLPLLFIWSLLLHIRKGKLFAFLLLLAPAAFALIIAQVPSEMSCWLIILSGSVYAAVYGCHEGKAALCKGFAATAVLTLLILLSAFVSRPLDAYKQPSDGFYARTRESIETGWIKPLRDSYARMQAKWNTRSQTTKKNNTDSENQPIPEQEKLAENESAPENTPNQENGVNQESEPKQENGAGQENGLNQENAPEQENNSNQDFTGNNIRITDDSGQSNLSQSGSGQEYAGTGGSIDTFPDLNALSYFQPDSGTRLTLTLDSRPEDTVYYPSAYGVLYDNSRWMEASANSMEIYLQYPDTLKRLQALCQENQPETLEDVSRFIQKEFEDHTVYDYEPGPTPSGSDFAEYFLFDNQKGFCVHFATTAALMYRMCGYPSRYVQGYAVPPSAFHRQEDGSYTADVTGEMGHAWCEVFEDGEWVLKEHTLPYYGARPRSGIPAVSESGRSWVPNAAGWALLILKLCTIGFACFLAAAFIFFTQAALRRQRRYRRFCTVRTGAGIQRMYHAIYETALFQGMKQTDILSLQGFQTLRDFLPEVPPDSMEWLYQTVLETMFYQKAATKEDTKQAFRIYRQFSRKVKKELSPSRKFIYSYIKIM